MSDVISKTEFETLLGLYNMSHRGQFEGERTNASGILLRKLEKAGLTLERFHAYLEKNHSDLVLHKVAEKPKGEDPGSFKKTFSEEFMEALRKQAEKLAREAEKRREEEGAREQAYEQWQKKHRAEPSGNNPRGYSYTYTGTGQKDYGSHTGRSTYSSPNYGYWRASRPQARRRINIMKDLKKKFIREIADGLATRGSNNPGPGVCSVTLDTEDLEILTDLLSDEISRVDCLTP